MKLMESSFGQVADTSNQTGDKNKAVRREITGPMSRKQEQSWVRGRQKGEEGKPLRTY